MLRAEQTNDYLYTFVTKNGTRLLLHALSDKILRFRYLTPGSPSEPDFSYAIPGADEAPARHPRVPTFVKFKEKSDHYCLTTTRLICIVWKDSLHTRPLDRSGTILTADDKGFHWPERNVQEIALGLRERRIPRGQPAQLRYLPRGAARLACTT